MNKLFNLISNILLAVNNKININEILRNSLLNSYSNFIRSINIYNRIKMFYIILSLLNLLFTFLVVLYFSNIEWDIFTPIVLLLGLLSKITPLFIEDLITEYYLTITSYIKVTIRDILLRILDLDKIFPNNFLNENNYTSENNESTLNDENNKTDQPILIEGDVNKPKTLKDRDISYWICSALIGIIVFGICYWYFIGGIDYFGGSDDNSESGITDNLSSGSITPRAEEYVQTDKPFMKYKRIQTESPIVLEKEIQAESPVVLEKGGVFPWLDKIFVNKGVQTSPHEGIPTIVVESPTAPVEERLTVHVDYNVLPGDSQSQRFDSPTTPSIIEGIRIPILDSNQENISPIDSRPETELSSAVSSEPLKIIPRAGLEYIASIPLPESVASQSQIGGNSSVLENSPVSISPSLSSSSEDITKNIPGSFQTTKGRYALLPINVQEPFSETPIVSPEPSLIAENDI
jgi:hypothetical protein